MVSWAREGQSIWTDRLGEMTFWRGFAKAFEIPDWRTYRGTQSAGRIALELNIERLSYICIVHEIPEATKISCTA